MFRRYSKRNSEMPAVESSGNSDRRRNFEIPAAHEIPTLEIVWKVAEGEAEVKSYLTPLTGLDANLVVRVEYDPRALVCPRMQRNDGGLPKLYYGRARSRLHLVASVL